MGFALPHLATQVKSAIGLIIIKSTGSSIHYNGTFSMHTSHGETWSSNTEETIHTEKYPGVPSDLSTASQKSGQI